MNPRKQAREAIALSQSDAARRASVSFATWRRWEEDPDSVRQSTREACERVLDFESRFQTELEVESEKFVASWADKPHLTPRQASAIAGTLHLWADLYIREWLRDPSSEPLHQVTPFDALDLRVMMLVGENRAWAAKFAERCDAVADEIAEGVLPFDRAGCFADELLMGMCLDDARTQLEDMPELYEAIPARGPGGADGDDDGYWVHDAGWDAVSDGFDDRCRWDEWEVPLMRDYPLLSAILAAHHPFAWFDLTTASGPGYLNRLAEEAAGVETR